jgi:hypothetical protein
MNMTAARIRQRTLVGRACGSGVALIGEVVIGLADADQCNTAVGSGFRALRSDEPCALGCFDCFGADVRF